MPRLAPFLFIVLLIPLAYAIPAHAGSSWRDGVVIVVYGSQYGTGWWVSKDVLVTAGHVVNYQENATVQLIRGDWKGGGVVVYVDSKKDVAVIKTDGMPSGAYIFSIASRVDELKTLYVIGYPYEIVELSGDLTTASEDPRVARGFAAWYDHDYNLIEF
jgi:S1-C subfamily serine protease